jgi:hypothetical protein
MKHRSCSSLHPTLQCASKCRRYEEALADSEQAVALAPEWDKAHFRRGSALKGLIRNPQAALALRSAWLLDKGGYLRS